MRESFRSPVKYGSMVQREKGASEARVGPINTGVWRNTPAGARTNSGVSIAAVQNKIAQLVSNVFCCRF